MTSINDMPLLSRDELVRRLSALAVPGRGAQRVPGMTMGDVARWCDVARQTLYLVAKGRPISNRVQIRLTQFYALLDSGVIVMELHGQHKHFVRRGGGTRGYTESGSRVEFTPRGPVVKW